MQAVIAGREFRLRLTAGALRRLEEDAGRPFGAVLRALADPDMQSVGDMVRLVTCAANEMDRGAVREAAEEATVPELAAIMRDLLRDAGMLGGAETVGHGGHEGNV